MNAFYIEAEDMMELTRQERQYYDKKYQTDGKEELPFCIVVPTFNNKKGDRHLSNIRSIARQEYENYHVVVIDDASTDGTGYKVEEWLEEEGKMKEGKFRVRRNN